MSVEDPLQRNIRRTTARRALKEIRALVDEEIEREAAASRAVQWLKRYGWIILLVIAALLAHLMGVY